MKLLLYLLLSLIFHSSTMASNDDFRATGRVLWDSNTRVLGFPGITLESKFTDTTTINLDAELISGEAAY